jgi:hypothetical protein
MNFTFADRETGTRWQQETGEAFEGALKGRRLEIHPFLITTWKEWRDRHPDTRAMVPVRRTILARRPGRPGPPADRTLRPEDPRLAAYEPVVGLEAGGARRAYPLELLAKERVVNDQLGGEAVLVIFRPESDTVTAFSRQVDGHALTFERHAQSDDVVDIETGSRWNPYGECLEGKLRGRRLSVIVRIRQFWWSWAAFFPSTDVYRGFR